MCTHFRRISVDYLPNLFTIRLFATCLITCFLPFWACTAGCASVYQISTASFINDVGLSWGRLVQYKFHIPKWSNKVVCKKLNNRQIKTKKMVKFKAAETEISSLLVSHMSQALKMLHLASLQLERSL